MNIVVEGVDAAGKSTLIRAIRKRIGEDKLPLVASEGPPKYAGEMNERVSRYLNHNYVIFDRHPCISQPIYGIMRSHRDTIDPGLIAEFYSRPNLFVYCRPIDGAQGFKRHTFNEGVDSREHLAQVEANYATLLHHYDTWARDHAHIVYRLGVNFNATVAAIVEYYNAR